MFFHKFIYKKFSVKYNTLENIGSSVYITPYSLI